MNLKLMFSHLEKEIWVNGWRVSMTASSENKWARDPKQGPEIFI